MADERPPSVPNATCPICGAVDAFVEHLQHRDVVYVECVNCRVYLATRKAFRHFEYLRWRQDPNGLAKLAKLKDALCASPAACVLLEFEKWEELVK